MRRRAFVDGDALAANLNEIPIGVIDLRADAYGHQIRHVGAVARACGIDTALVSHERDAAAARATGLATVFDAHLDTVMDADAVFGTNGSHRAVLTLSGELIAVKEVPAGVGVSYGYTHRTSRDTRLGLVGLGYADGVPRLASNRAEVSVAGVRHPLIGRVAMDQLVLDLGSADAHPGDEVILFGAASTGVPGVHEWAAWTERPALALTAGLGQRIRREV